MKYLKFEFKRLLRTKIIAILIGIGIFISCMSFLYNYSNQFLYIDTFYKMYGQLYNNIEKSIIYFDDPELIARVPSERIPLLNRIQNNLLKLRENLTKLFELSEDVEKADQIPAVLLSIMELYSDEITRFDKSISIENRASGSVNYLKQKLLNQTLVDKNYPFEHPNLSLSGFNLAKITLNRIIGLPLLLAYLVLTSRIFTEEKELGVEKLRKMDPGSRFQAYLAKTVLLTIILSLFLIVVTLTSLILGKLFGTGLGHYDYPEVLSNYKAWVRPENLRLIDESYLGQISVMELLFRWIYLFSAYAFFIFSILALLTIVFKETRLVLFSGFVSIAIISYINNVILSLTHLEKFIPFPLLGEKYNLLADYLDLKTTLLFGIPILLGFPILYLAAKLEKNKFIESLFTRKKEGDIKLLLKKWKTSKISRFPLLNFEILKLKRRNELILYLFIFLIAFSGYGIIKQKEYGKTVHLRILNAKSQLENSVNEDPVESKLIKDYISAYVIKDKEEITKVNKNLITNFANNSFGFRGFDSDKFTYETTMLNVNQEEKNSEGNHLSELLNEFPIRITPYDEFNTLNDFQNYLIHSKRYHPSMHMVGNYFYSGIGAVILIVATGLLLTDGFTGEQERKSLRIILMQPLERLKIFMSKQIMIVFFAVLVLMSWFTWLGYGMAIGQLSDANYPIQTLSAKPSETKEVRKFSKRNLNDEFGRKIENKEINQSETIKVEYTPVWKQNLKLTLLLLAIGLFIISLGNAMSTIITNRWLSGTILILICGLGYILTFNTYSLISGLLPFQWLYPYSVVYGRLSLRYDIGYLHAPMGIIVLLAWSLLLVLIGLVGFKRMARGGRR